MLSIEREDLRELWEESDSIDTRRSTTILRRPVKIPSPRTLILIALLSAVGTAGFGYGVCRAGEQLDPNSILAFEFAFTPSNAVAIMDTWGADLGPVARDPLREGRGWRES